MSNYMLLTEMSAYSNAVQQYGKDAADFWSQCITKGRFFCYMTLCEGVCK